ncbi:unnamed protein product, partial [Rotaria magnacalcarata]
VVFAVVFRMIQHVWQLLNDSINECLVLPRPSATSCTRGQFNMEPCTIIYTNWMNSKWRIEQLGAMQYYNWEMPNVLYTI